MKRFKITIFLAVILVVAFLHITVSTGNVGSVNAVATESKKGYTVTGEILPFYKVYKGYEYSIENGAAKIKIKTSFGLFGEKDFEIEIGKCKYIYITDGKENKEIGIKR